MIFLINPESFKPWSWSTLFTQTIVNRVICGHKERRNNNQKAQNLREYSGLANYIRSEFGMLRVSCVICGPTKTSPMLITYSLLLF